MQRWPRRTGGVSIPARKSGLRTSRNFLWILVGLDPTTGRLTGAGKLMISDDFNCFRSAQNQQFKSVPGIVPVHSNALEKTTR
jgi:hypothetical protein